MYTLGIDLSKVDLAGGRSQTELVLSFYLLTGRGS